MRRTFRPHQQSTLRCAALISRLKRNSISMAELAPNRVPPRGPCRRHCTSSQLCPQLLASLFSLAEVEHTGQASREPRRAVGWLGLPVPRCVGQEAGCSSGSISLLGRAISGGGRGNGSQGGVSSDSSGVSRERLHWDVFLESGLHMFFELYIAIAVKREVAICLMHFEILTNSSPRSCSE